MRRAVVLALLVALVAVPALAQTKAPEFSLAKKAESPPWLFHGLQVQFTALSWGDYCMTAWAVTSGYYEEANPLAAWYVHKSYLAIPILAGMDLLVHGVLNGLYRDNKTLAWAVLIALNVTRAYVLYHNLRQARR